MYPYRAFRLRGYGMADVVGPVGSDLTPPGNLVELVDKHLTRATESPEMLRRYVWLLFVLVACALAMVAGTAFIVVHLHVHVLGASGIAGGGVFMFAVTAVTATWRAKRKPRGGRRDDKTSS